MNIMRCHPEEQALPATRGSSRFLRSCGSFGMTIIMVLFFPTLSHACGCYGFDRNSYPVELKYAYDRADVVMLGEVVDIDMFDATQLVVRLRPVHTWKSYSDASVTVRTHIPDMCGYDFRAAKHHLIYADYHPFHTDELWINRCSRSRPMNGMMWNNVDPQKDMRILNDYNFSRNPRW